jgi:hypothetical protein
MAYVEINITGGEYQPRSRNLSSQITRNFWPQIQDGEAKSDYILESPPGLKLFSAGSGKDRGVFEHLGALYKVTGNTLESISNAGVRTTIGTIPGTSRCIFDAVSTLVTIVSDGVAYTWDGSSFVTGSDVDFESPDTVTVLNSQAIYDGIGGRFGVSDAGDPLDINGLNYGTAEGESDNLLRPYAFNQVVQMFCERHIEGWWNSGSGNPPFDRLEGGLFQIGLGAVYSVANNKNYIYFLGNDRNVYRMAEGRPESGFTPKPLLREFTNYDSVSDAIGWCMNYQGQEYYFLKFPSANKTHVYAEGGQWFEMSSSVYDIGPTAGRYMGNSHCYAFGKHLIADEDGNLLELDEETFTDNGHVTKRVRDLAPIHGGLVGAPGKKITLTFFKLILETGTAAVDQKIMLSFSIDGGRTFGTEMWGDIGEQGDYLTPVEWSGINVEGESIVVRISTSDPYYYSLHSAGVELEIGI